MWIWQINSNSKQMLVTLKTNWRWKLWVRKILVMLFHYDKLQNVSKKYPWMLLCVESTLLVRTTSIDNLLPNWTCYKHQPEGLIDKNWDHSNPIINKNWKNVTLRPTSKNCLFPVQVKLFFKMSRLAL